MAKRSSNESGTPCWVELASTDIEGSKQFYGELFGWDFQGMTTPEDIVYTMCFPKGDFENPIAAIMPAPDMGTSPKMSFWATYVSVDDLEASMAKVEAAGGQVMMAPMDVTPMDGVTVGRMAAFLDPAGAALCLWQPMAHIGATIVNEPGTFCWSELSLPSDIGAVTPFYEQVFGWHTKTHSMMPMSYTEFLLNGKPVAGGMTIPSDHGGEAEAGDHAGEAESPGMEMPPHWAVYFGANDKDVDATFAKAQHLGATPLVEPMDIPGGRFATMMDPQSAVFNFCWMEDFDG